MKLGGIRIGNESYMANSTHQCEPARWEIYDVVVPYAWPDQSNWRMKLFLSIVRTSKIMRQRGVTEIHLHQLHKNSQAQKTLRSTSATHRRTIALNSNVSIVEKEGLGWRRQW